MPTKGKATMDASEYVDEDGNPVYGPSGLRLGYERMEAILASVNNNNEGDAQ